MADPAPLDPLCPPDARPKEIDHYAPFRKLKSLHPKLFGPRFDKTRSVLSYGRWALPKLIHDLASVDNYTVACALHSLNDKLQDGHEGYRAIIHLGVVQQLARLLRKLRFCSCDSEYCLLKCCINLEYCASRLDGALRIMDDPKICNDLYFIITRSTPPISKAASRVLMQLSEKVEVADLMIEGRHFRKLRNVIDFVDDCCELFETIANLTERNNDIAIDHGFFEFMLPRLVVKHECQKSILKIFALLVHSPKGQNLCDLHDVVPIYYQLLSNYELSDEHMEFVTMGAQNCMQSTRTHWRARELWDLSLVLLAWCHHKTNENIQIYALQTLRQISEMPSVKFYIRKTCYPQVLNVCCLSPRVKVVKDDLLWWLNYKNYDNEYSEKISTQQFERQNRPLPKPPSVCLENLEDLFENNNFICPF